MAKKPKGPHPLTKAAEKRETRAQERKESPAFERMERKMGLEQHGAGDRLTTKQRKGLPKSDFGLPGKRAYPMPDKAHARNAKSRAAQFATPAEKAKIDAKANRILGKGKKKGAGDMAGGMPATNLAATAANMARQQAMRQGALKGAAGPRGK